MTARIPLGARVKVSRVFELPPKPGAGDHEDHEMVEFAPVDNPKSEAVAIVIGVAIKATRFYVRSSYMGDQEAVWWEPVPNFRRRFYVIRYTLTGRRRYTLPEFMEVLP